MTRYNGRGPARRPDVTALDPDQLQEIETGYGFFSPFRGSPDLFRAGWETYKDSLLDEWIAKHPGTRPFAWWLFEGVPKHGERRPTKYHANIAPYRENWVVHGILHTHLIPPCQESEAEYLDRNGLLSPAEKLAIGLITPAVEQFRQQYPDLSRKLDERPFTIEVRI